jgi:hypothetical protein
MRFRLRTLLIVTMLAGPLIGLAWNWRTSNLQRAEQLRIQTENEQWRRAAFKSARVVNGKFVFSKKMRAEFRRRFGQYPPEYAPWHDPPWVNPNGTKDPEPEPPPWVYIPSSHYDKRP